MKKTTFLHLLMILILGSLSLPARATTWYLRPPVTGTWTTLTNWNSQPLGSGTNPTAINATDDFDLNGFGVSTPKSGVGTTTFGGNHLIFHGGNDGTLSTQVFSPGILAIPNIISYGGRIKNTVGGVGIIQVTNFVNNANTVFDSSAKSLDIRITTLTGAGDISVRGLGAGAAGGPFLFSATTATGFTGTLYITGGSQFTFTSAVTSGGPLNVSGAATAVTVNNTVTFKGLTISGTVKSPGTYTPASLGFSGTGSVVVQAPVVTSPAPVTTMIGVNLPGASFTPAFYPTDALVWNYLQTKNANLVRVAFKWERVQPTLNGALDSGALASLDSVASLAAARNQKIFLDMHNYNAYSISGTSYQVGSTQVPYSALQDVWQKLAAHFAGNAAIYGYDIMNEPAGTIANWSSAAQAAINGVRTSDTTHNIIVESINWSHAEGWMTTNASLNVTDPSNKIIYSAHTYWSKSGNDNYLSYDAEDGYANMGVDRIAAFTYWCQLKGAKGLIGEFGVPNNVASPAPGWNVALDKFLNYCNVNGVQGTYWSMTQNGWPDTYALLCAKGGKAPGPVVDAPAMAVLQNYFGGGGGLPSPWVAQDVGAVASTGTTSYSGGTFTVGGSGTQFVNSGTADAFQYVYQPASGDCSLTARVVTLNAQDSLKGEGAVMIRNDLTAGSMHAMMGVTTGRGLNFTYRLATSGSSVNVAGPSGTAPYWVRMTRVGNTFTAYRSPDNVTWTQVGTPQTISMGTNVYIGMPAAGHGAGLEIGTFDNVTAAP